MHDCLFKWVRAMIYIMIMECCLVVELVMRRSAWIDYFVSNGRFLRFHGFHTATWVALGFS